MVTALEQSLREVLPTISGTESFADTALHFFPDILNWIHTWAVSWPFQQFDIEWGDDSSQIWRHDRAQFHVKLTSLSLNHSFTFGKRQLSRT
jgi:hypothetical protein